MSSKYRYRTYESRKAFYTKRRTSVLSYLKAIKVDGSCKICGWMEHPEILHFHHRDPSTKRCKLSIGNMGNYSMKTVQEEIDKCDLLCPNCHAWHHYQDRSIFNAQQVRLGRTPRSYRGEHVSNRDLLPIFIRT